MGLFIATVTSYKSMPGMALFLSWGVTRWIGIIPLILHQRRRKRSAVVQGLIITGCIGSLLGSPCAWMLFQGNI